MLPAVVCLFVWLLNGPSTQEVIRANRPNIRCGCSLTFYPGRLQSFLYVAPRFTNHLGCYDHITSALVSLPWLRVPDGADYKFAVQSYCLLHGSDPNYLKVRSSTHRRHRQPTAHALICVRAAGGPGLQTQQCRAPYAVAAPLFWNTLPLDIQIVPYSRLL
jgi:hypothetical protein